jgi:hypothetical protein
MAVLPQIYADARITDQTKKYDKIHFEKTQGRYPWFVIDQAGAPLNLYGEMDEGQGEPSFTQFGVLVAMRVILEPERQLLKRWGITKPRDALVEHSIAHLEEIGLTPKIGDRFDFNNEQYEIMGDGNEGFIWNQKNPLRFVMAANKALRIKTA